MVVHVTCTDGRGGEGDKVRAHPSLCTQPHTLEPRFNEVPRDWENLLVISRALVILKTSISRIFVKTSKTFIISRYG